MRNVPSFLAAVSLICGVAHVAGAAEPNWSLVCPAWIALVASL